MPDTTPDLIEMERRINELSAEVCRLRARQRRFPTRGIALALLLGVGVASLPVTTGAQNAPILEAVFWTEIRKLEAAREQTSINLGNRIKALEDTLARPLTVQGPFTVLGPGGTVVMKAEMRSGTPNMTIGDPVSGSVAIGVGASHAGFVLVRKADGTDGVAMGLYRGGGMGLHVVGADGETAEGSLALDASGNGYMAVGKTTSGGTTVGVGKTGGGFVMVRRADAKLGIGLGQYEGRPMSIGVFGDGEKELVSLRTDKQGGTVRVMVPSGTAVAALLAGDNGGGLALTSPAGGKSAVSLGVEPSGGKVRVYAAAGGTAHAEMTAESSGGAMTLYTSAGAPSALLQTGDGGAGRLEISRSGTIFVEAGVANGRGIVRAGPVVGGPPLGALGFADTIMGKVK